MKYLALCPFRRVFAVLSRERIERFSEDYCQCDRCLEYWHRVYTHTENQDQNKTWEDGVAWYKALTVTQRNILAKRAR